MVCLGPYTFMVGDEVEQMSETEFLELAAPPAPLEEFCEHVASPETPILIEGHPFFASIAAEYT